MSVWKLLMNADFYIKISIVPWHDIYPIKVNSLGINKKPFRYTSYPFIIVRARSNQLATSEVIKGPSRKTLYAGLKTSSPMSWRFERDRASDIECQARYPRINHALPLFPSLIRSLLEQLSKFYCLFVLQDRSWRIAHEANAIESIFITYGKYLNVMTFYILANIHREFHVNFVCFFLSNIVLATADEKWAHGKECRSWCVKRNLNA